MNQTSDGFERLLDRWLADASFRDAFQTDPGIAIQSGDFDLSTDDVEMMRSANWNLSDGLLAARTNKPRTRI